MWICTLTPDNVTWIDIFEIELHLFALKIVLYGITQVNSNITEFSIAGSIAIIL